MKNKFAQAFVMFSVVLLMSGCAKVPQAELDAAKAAVEDARSQGAAEYVPAEFNLLQDSLNAVNEMIEARKGKLFASFGEVRTKLAQITEQSSAVISSTESRKAEVQAQVDAAMIEVNSLLSETKTLVAAAPKGKEGAAAVDAISAELAVVESSVAEATSLVEQGKWLQSLDKLNAAKEKVSAVKAELESVIAKFRSRR